MDPSRLRDDLPVEWLGDDNEPDESEGWLRHGQPGRITDPAMQDVFVEWVGLEDAGVSRWICYDYQGLGEISEEEFTRRADRLRQGLPPLD